MTFNTPSVSPCTLGQDPVPAVDPLGATDVQAGGEDHHQIHTHAEQDEGARY